MLQAVGRHSWMHSLLGHCRVILGDVNTVSKHVFHCVPYCNVCLQCCLQCSNCTFNVYPTIIQGGGGEEAALGWGVEN